MGLWFWIPFAVIIVLYTAFIIYTWIVGTFRRIFMGIRVINLMIAIQIFGLLLMLLALIIFFASGPSGYTLSLILLQIGLVCAVPAAIYLVVWLLHKFLFQDNAIPDPAVINEDWFLQQQLENEERKEQTIALTIQLENQLQQKDEEMLKLQRELAEKLEQIKEEKSEPQVDPALVAQLEKEREELEFKKAEAEKSKQDMASETEELKRERELLRAELDRLEQDRKKFEELEQSIKDAQTKQDADRSAAFESELLKLKEEQQQKQEELAAELEAAREQIESELTQEKERAIEEEMAALRATLESYNYMHHPFYAQPTYPVGHPYYFQQGQQPPPQPQVAGAATTVIVGGVAAAEMPPEDNEELQSALKRIQELEDEKNAKKLLAKQKRQLKNAELKAMFNRENVAKYIKKYLVETSACFLMDRNLYKDRFGLGPYNRIIVEEGDGKQKKEKVTHLMACTEDKLYKFGEILIDLDRFFKHKELFPAFVDLVNEGTSLVRISEKLHLLYTQFHKKDFVKDLRYKEDFDNILVLASNHFVVRHLNFKVLFANVPFNPTLGLTEDEAMIEALCDPHLQATFLEYFPNFSDLGFKDKYQAIAACFVAAKKDVLSQDQIAQIILKDAAKLGKILLRESKKKRK